MPISCAGKSVACLSSSAMVVPSMLWSLTVAEPGSGPSKIRGCSDRAVDLAKCRDTVSGAGSANATPSGVDASSTGGGLASGPVPSFFSILIPFASERDMTLSSSHFTYPGAGSQQIFHESGEAPAFSSTIYGHVYLLWVNRDSTSLETVSSPFCTMSVIYAQQCCKMELTLAIGARNNPWVLAFPCV